ncbi:hypothetical protein CMO93_00855 [Candidatus Woesearchaeota archaeon]|nr:hypothetical protein [Candidatus Woesearchaeota archaeon]|tara:strand:- start:1360 stop:2118 length:759 start_codon:yes stop_codon:yes gene_type:complete
MGEIVDLWDKIKRYYTFTPSEIRGLIIAIIVIAFIISFSEWGAGDAANLSLGFFNFFNSILIVALSFLVHISAQRIWSLGTGYRLEWKMWGFGLLAGLIVVFLTNGKFWLILPGGFIVHHLAGHRLGWFRYDINWWAVGLIAVMGPLASIIIAILFKALSAAAVNSLIQKLIMFNIAYALYSLLPIPPLDGSKTFYGSRMLYAFSTTGIVAAAILLTLNISVGIAVIASFLIGIVLWVLYYIFFESKIWHAG